MSRDPEEVNKLTESTYKVREMTEITLKILMLFTCWVQHGRNKQICVDVPNTSTAGWHSWVVIFNSVVAGWKTFDLVRKLSDEVNVTDVGYLIMFNVINVRNSAHPNQVIHWETRVGPHHSNVNFSFFDAPKWFRSLNHRFKHSYSDSSIFFWHMGTYFTMTKLSCKSNVFFFFFKTSKNT